jgi:heavy metal sensor kinase
VRLRRPRNVRTRLTLWYTLVLAVALSLHAAFAAAFFFWSLRHELDRNLSVDSERIEDRLAFEADGRLQLRPSPLDEEDDIASARRVEVWTPEGQVLYRTPRLAAGALGRFRDPGRRTYRSLVLPDGSLVRMRAGFERIEGRRLLLRVAHSEKRLWHEWGEFLPILLSAFPITLGLAALGGHWLARRALRPLDQMARQAEGITADRLGERLPVENPDDELGHLARVINLMLARVEASFTQLRRFTADASHELRTPLTAIRSVGEVALQQARSPEGYRETLGSMLEEVTRLSRLVDSLLVLSRADASDTVLNPQLVDLRQVARETASFLEALAEEKDQELEVSGPSGVQVEVDPLIFRQSLLNLLDNAIKYSPASSSIQMSVSADGPHAIVDVTDSGSGIPNEHQAGIFERFYRADASRSRGEGGVGLGLSIARWGVAAHGGELSLLRSDRSGSTFRIRLPRAV